MSTPQSHESAEGQEAEILKAEETKIEQAATAEGALEALEMLLEAERKYGYPEGLVLGGMPVSSQDSTDK